MPPLPQPGINSYDQNGMGQQQQQQQPYGSQQFGQPPNQGYPQQPPIPYQQQQQQPVMNQPPMPQQPMGMGQQQQQFRPQQPIQPVAKPKIDPDQIPSPVAVQENDQAQWDDTPFITSSKTLVTPLASSDFMAIDEGKRTGHMVFMKCVLQIAQTVIIELISFPLLIHIGNCNPRFFRMTTYNVPNTEDLLSTAQMPMGLVIQPLAKLRADEVRVLSFSATRF